MPRLRFTVRGMMVAVAIVGVVAGSYACRRSMRDSQQIAEGIPADEEIVRVSATLIGKYGNNPPAAEFVVPDRYVPLLLDAFRPAAHAEYPKLWDELAIGELCITTRDGRINKLGWGFCGQNPLCYTYAGIQCIRSRTWGETEHFSGQDGQFLYSGDCVGLESFLTKVHDEIESGKESADLAELLATWQGRTRPIRGERKRSARK
jgi:hypothetical protein